MMSSLHRRSFENVTIRKKGEKLSDTTLKSIWIFAKKKISFRIQFR